MVEPLLGSEDAKALGILKINPEGELVLAVVEETPSSVQEIIQAHAIIFEGIGKFQDEEIEFNIDDNVKPVIQREATYTISIQRQTVRSSSRIKNERHH